MLDPSSCFSSFSSSFFSATSFSPLNSLPNVTVSSNCAHSVRPSNGIHSFALSWKASSNLFFFHYSISTGILECTPLYLPFVLLNSSLSFSPVPPYSFSFSSPLLSSAFLLISPRNSPHALPTFLKPTVSSSRIRIFLMDSWLSTIKSSSS